MSLLKGKSLNILQIIPSLQSGGAERGCLEIADGLSSSGYRNHIITEHVASSIVIPDMTEIHTIPVASKNPFRLLHNATAIQKLVKKYQIDLIHVRSRAPAWSTQLAKVQINVPVLSTCHGCYRVPNRIKHWYNRSITTYPDHIIAPSNFVIDYLKQHYPASLPKTTVINRGVDLDLFDQNNVCSSKQSKLITALDLDPNKPILFIPARYSKFKGQSNVITALSLLQDRSVQAVFCGKKQDNAYFSLLQKQVHYFDLDTQVRLLPPISELTTAYSIADITICPSISEESFGRVPIEAAAMGSIALASQHSGFMHTIVPEKTGFLFKTNCPDDLSKKIKHILSLDEQQKQLITQSAYERVNSEFSKNQMVEKTLRIYKNLIRNQI